MIIASGGTQHPAARELHKVHKGLFLRVFKVGWRLIRKKSSLPLASKKGKRNNPTLAGNNTGPDVIVLATINPNITAFKKRRIPDRSLKPVK